MATAHGIISVDIYLPGKSPTDVANLLTECTTSPKLLRERLANIVGASSIGFGGVGLVARPQGGTQAAASSSFTVTESSSTVNDKLVLITPAGAVTLTCVADAAENPFLGQFAGNASDNAYATSIRLAINSYPPAKALVSAAGSTNTVALTSVLEGDAGNTIKLVKQVTTAGTFSFTSGVAFTGGYSFSTAKTALITVGTLPVANDTLRFGNVVLTWKAAAANENEITIGASTTTVAATNLQAKLAAHSILGGLFTSSPSTNTVTLTAAYPNLLLSQLYIASSTANVTVANQLAQTGVTFTATTGTAATQGVF